MRWPSRAHRVLHDRIGFAFRNFRRSVPTCRMDIMSPAVAEVGIMLGRLAETVDIDKQDDESIDGRIVMFLDELIPSAAGSSGLLVPKTPPPGLQLYEFTKETNAFLSSDEEESVATGMPGTYGHAELDETVTNTSGVRCGLGSDAARGVGGPVHEALPEGLDAQTLSDIMSQLGCTADVAISAYVEMNIYIVTDELCCSRDWAVDLLARHGSDPCTVRQRETNFCEQVNGHIDDPDFELTELRTTWGTTVPVSDDDGLDLVFSVNGRHVRADPDLLKFEWVESVRPLKTPALSSVSDVDGSTTDASDSEKSACASMSSASFCTDAHLVIGATVMLQALRNAPELNGRRAQIVCFIPTAQRYEIDVEGCAGSKSVRAAKKCIR